MKLVFLFLAGLAAFNAAPSPANAISLDEACNRFAAKLQTAVTAGNNSQAKSIYSQGSQRIASKFNGATCPNVKAP